MNFSVLWAPLAFNQMDVIVRAMPERKKALASNLKSMMAALRNHPSEEGESREDTRRVWFCEHLMISYDVDPATRTVTIQSVKLVSVP